MKANGKASRGSMERERGGQTFVVRRDGSDQEDVTCGIVEQQYYDWELTHAWSRPIQYVYGEEKLRHVKSG